MPRSARPRLTSRQNPLVARFRAVARGDDRTRMLLDGVHLVAEALSAGTRIETVIADPDESGDVGVLFDALAEAGADVVAAAPAVMAAVSPLRSPSAICAVAVRPSTTAQQLYVGNPLIVFACDVQDPGNLGAIVRVCEAAGASGVVAAGASADPFGWKALRGSMGSALRLPVITAPDLVAAVQSARERKCRVVATVARSGESLFAARLTGPVALLVGGEGGGLPAEALHLSDGLITIPMAAPVESLNVAVAAALVVYEARRQRSYPDRP